MAAPGTQLIPADKLELLLRTHGVELGDRRLRQLAKDGYFPEPDRGQYEFLATLVGLIKYFRELHAKKSDTRKAIEDRTALAKCEIAETEAARVKGEVEEVAEVERARIALVVLIRQKLLALPAQAAGYLACCDTQAKMEAELERQIEKILTELEAPAFAARPDPVPANGAGEQPRP